jgi:hypothetical protein
VAVRVAREQASQPELETIPLGFEAGEHLATHLRLMATRPADAGVRRKSFTVRDHRPDQLDRVKDPQIGAPYGNERLSPLLDNVRHVASVVAPARRPLAHSQHRHKGEAVGTNFREADYGVAPPVAGDRPSRDRARVVTCASRAQARDQPTGSPAAQRVEGGQQELIVLESEQGMLESEIARRES